jgi:hypothetical protein
VDLIARSAIDHWKSPVLLVQGDDDRNVEFQQTMRASFIESTSVSGRANQFPAELPGPFSGKRAEC